MTGKRLDTRRLGQVRAKDPKAEDLSADTYNTRLLRTRMTEIIGAEATEEYMRNRESFSKQWYAMPVDTSPYEHLPPRVATPTPRVDGNRKKRGTDHA